MACNRPALVIIAAGLLAAANVGDPTIKMLFLCVAGFGFFAVLPVFFVSVAFMLATAIMALFGERSPAAQPAGD